MKVYAIMDLVSGKFLDIDMGEYVLLTEATLFATLEEAKKNPLSVDEMLEEGAEEVVVPVTLVVGEPVV